ncbi:MAG: PIN domain-containing protein [Terrimicrobiaceae bacterium]|nr:PIN domain-containing protein [Terrimicrobiaceae bacterium]
MKSYTLDTSFLVRLLTRQPLALFQEAARFLDRWKQDAPRLSVPDLALAEAYFALQTHYSYPKADALAALQALSQHPAIEVSAAATAVLPLPDLGSAKPGFVDRLIHAAVVDGKATLVTFEKSARKLPHTLVLGS